MLSVLLVLMSNSSISFCGQIIIPAVWLITGIACPFSAGILIRPFTFDFRTCLLLLMYVCFVLSFMKLLTIYHMTKFQFCL